MLTLLGQEELTTDNLELIDSLISRARDTGVSTNGVKFVSEDERVIDLDMAYRVRYDLGMDIR